MNPEGLKNHLIENPPIDANGNRKRGSTHHDEFWRGFDGGRCNSAKGSMGEAGYLAGIEYRKVTTKE
jgi:hypothetical protein